MLLDLCSYYLHTIVNDIVTHMAFRVESIDYFTNEWEVYNNQENITIKMDDGLFSFQITNGIYNIYEGDIIHCEVQIIQTITENGLETKYIVKRVLKHYSVADVNVTIPKQLNLINDNN